MNGYGPIVSCWRACATAVREHDGGLRWTLDAWTSDLETVVTVDTTRSGHVFDVQSDGYVGTSGDDELDYECRRHIDELLAIRRVLLALDRIERPLHRSDRVRRPR